MSVWLHMTHVDKMSQEVGHAFPKWGRRHTKEENKSEGAAVRALLSYFGSGMQWRAHWCLPTEVIDRTGCLHHSSQSWIITLPLNRESDGFLRVEEGLMGRRWGKSRDTHLERWQGRRSTQSHYSHLYQMKLSSPSAFLDSSIRPNTWVMMV